jgi:hypothetical protein
MENNANAYAGHARLDKINLMDFKSSADTPEKILFLQTILDAAHQYLFFGLSGRNGTTAQGFWFSYEYFYNVRSTLPDTWKDSRIVYTKAYDDLLKRQIKRKQILTDNQLKAMCFDTQYDVANIPYSMDYFLRSLKTLRNQIVTDNIIQINKYLQTLKPSTQNHPNHDIITLDTKRVLVSPESPEELAQLVSLRTAGSKKRVMDGRDSKDSGNSSTGCNGFVST